MIWCDNRFWPLAGKGTHFLNTLFISPHTGQTWGRIDRGFGEWFPCRMAATGERPWPLPESIPGSLFSDYDDWRWHTIDELPRALLLRECSLLESWTSATLSRYNGTTNSTEPLQVNPSLMQEIAMLRAKEAAGSITDEELRTVLRKMREGRVTASARSSAARAKSAPIDPNKALEDFLG